MPETYTKADKIMAVLIESNLSNGTGTIKQEQIDAVLAKLEAAKDYETALAFNKLVANNLSAMNKLFEQFALVTVARSTPAMIVRLKAALSDVKAEIEKATAGKKG